MKNKKATFTRLPSVGNLRRKKQFSSSPHRWLPLMTAPRRSGLGSGHGKMYKRYTFGGLVLCSELAVV